jgi:hypothetical protein
MSIETRDVAGQDYSAIRGFFRDYTLTYIASDERDVIRLRTNYRKDEEVYLFRTTATPQVARNLFLEYLQRASSLHRHPEWYNALTNNCTTNIAVSAAQARDVRTRPDWRILLNGKMDEMMYGRGDLVTGGLPLPCTEGASSHLCCGETCRRHSGLLPVHSNRTGRLHGQTPPAIFIRRRSRWKD